MNKTEHIIISRLLTGGGPEATGRGDCRMGVCCCEWVLNLVIHSDAGKSMINCVGVRSFDIIYSELSNVTLYNFNLSL